MLMGTIDKNGFLFIDRGLPEMVRAMCPHTERACSHDCVLFGELDSTGNLEICGHFIHFSELIDERGAA